MAGSASWKIQVDSNVAKLLQETEQLRSELDGLTKDGFKLNIDDKKLQNVIANLDKMLASLSKGTGDFKSFEKLSSHIQEIVGEFKTLTTSIGNIDGTGLNSLVVSINNIEKSLSSLDTHITGASNNMGKMGQKAVGVQGNIRKVAQAAKQTSQEVERIAFTPNTEGFNDIISKFAILQERAENVKKIVKTTTSEGAVSYNAKFADGSSYILGEKSDPQMLKANEVVNNPGVALNKAYEEANKINNALKETEAKMGSLSKHKDLASNLTESNESVKRLNGQLTNGEISLSEYNKSINEIVGNYKKLSEIQQKRDTEVYNQSVAQKEKENAEKSANAYQELKEKIKEYGNVKKTIASGKSLNLSEDIEQANKLEAEIKELQKQSILNPSHLQKSEDSLRELDIQLKNIAKTSSNIKLTGMQGQINALQTSFDGFKLRTNQSGDYQAYLANLGETIAKLRQNLLKLKQTGLNPTDPSQLNGFNELIEKANEYRLILKNMPSSSKGSDETGRLKLMRKISDYLKANTKMSKQFREELENLYNTLKNGNSSTNLNKLEGEFQECVLKIRAAKQEGKRFFDVFKNSVINKFAYQLATYYFSLYDFIRYGRKVVENVVAIDNAIIELRKVSDASDSRLEETFKRSTKTAKELGATISDTISATSDWARMGYSIDDSEKLAEATILYTNVGDGIDTEAANESLISTLQGFQLDASEAESIVDKFNEVANNYAIDSAGIGEALKRSAASFNAANTDLSKSIALITTTNEVLQDPESVGTLWKTMSARLRGAKTELEELGEETDAYTESTSKLQSLVKGLTGFDIMKDKNTFKDVYEIVLGIGKEWKNLTDVEQASLGEALAGKRNSNGLYAVLNDIERLEEVYATAEGSAGSAMKEQENYERGVQYSIDRIKASAEEWSEKLLDSDVLKWFVDLGNAIVNISSALTPLGTIAAAGGIFAGIKNVGRDKVDSLKCLEYADNIHNLHRIRWFRVCYS